MPAKTIDYCFIIRKLYGFFFNITNFTVKYIIIKNILASIIVIILIPGRTQFVRLQGGVSYDSLVISGVPQGTVLGPLLFIILMCDINSGITSSMSSFADDTR